MADAFRQRRMAEALSDMHDLSTAQQSFQRSMGDVDSEKTLGQRYDTWPEKTYTIRPALPVGLTFFADLLKGASDGSVEVVGTREVDIPNPFVAVTFSHPIGELGAGGIDYADADFEHNSQGLINNSFWRMHVSPRQLRHLEIVEALRGEEISRWTGTQAIVPHL